MNKKQIKDLALSNGFKLKEQPSGKMDLNPYVYDFADALLAKANERVAELESQHQLLTKQIEPLLDMQEDGEYYTRCDLADDIYEACREGSSVDALNKFAIEKKIEALEFILGRVEPVTVSHVVKDHIVYYIKQLRNEQE